MSVTLRLPEPVVTVAGPWIPETTWSPEPVFDFSSVSAGVSMK